ncbi:MAG: cysteine rich repeat-containing protein [Myxococcota bacterium]|nr:cysteine rich repeat-containing protein [Myxococcota bacterium]
MPGARIAACFALALVLTPWGAAAQGQPPSRGAGAGGGACHADVMRLCSDVRGQRGAVRRCLAEHKDELTEDCRAQIAQRSEQARSVGKRVRQACAAELARFCPELTPGEGGMMRCLRPHEAELSEDCRAAIPPRSRGAGGGPPTP